MTETGEIQSRLLFHDHLDWGGVMGEFPLPHLEARYRAQPRGTRAVPAEYPAPYHQAYLDSLVTRLI